MLKFSCFCMRFLFLCFVYSSFCTNEIYRYIFLPQKFELTEHKNNIFNVHLIRSKRNPRTLIKNMHNLCSNYDSTSPIQHITFILLHIWEMYSYVLSCGIDGHSAFHGYVSLFVCECLLNIDMPGVSAWGITLLLLARGNVPAFYHRAGVSSYSYTFRGHLLLYL